MDVDMSKVACLIEIRGIYDGWSVAQMQDGALINRWDEEDRRHGPTQEWITRRLAALGGDDGRG